MAGNQLSQLPIEIVVLSTTPVDLAISQLPLEVVVDAGIPAIRTTQDVIETLSLPTPDQRVTQLSIETLSSNFATAEMRVTQDVIELLTANPVVVTSTETTQFYIVMP